MSDNSWTVEVDGVQRSITVATDANGRAAVRVDGKMAARPMGPEDEECTFRVGSGKYLLRRMGDGSFDLDLAPPDAEEIAMRRQTMGGAVPLPPPPKTGVRRFIGPAIFVAILVGLGWWIWSSTVYMRVPWQEWSSKRGRVTINFPGEPVDSTETVVEDGERFTLPTYEATFRDHTYVLQYLETDEPLPEAGASAILRDAIAAVADGRKMDEPIYRTVLGHQQARFTMHLPAEGDQPPFELNGIATSHGHIVYFAWVETPEGEGDSSDVADFLRSLRLPAEYAYAPNSAPTHEQRMAAIESQRAAMKEARSELRVTRLWLRVLISVGVLITGIFVLRWQSM